MTPHATRSIRATLAAFGLVLLAAGSAVAEPPREPYEVTLGALGAARAAFLQRTATAAGDLLRVGGLDMTNHTLVGIEPVEPGVTLDVALYKPGNPEPVRTGRPDARGSIVFAFRTYDEFGIAVKADRPTEYRIAVLASPPIQPPLPSPFTTPDAAGAGDAGRVALVAVGGALVCGVAWLLWRRRGGRRSAPPAVGAAVVIALLGAGVLHAAHAEPTPPAATDPGETAASPGEAGGAGAPPAKDWTKDPEKLAQMNDQMKVYADLLGKAISLYLAIQKVGALADQDLAFEPDYAPPGMPRVPSQCAVSAACNACFAPAYDELGAVRRKLENNRIVLVNFTRRMNAIEDAGRGLGGLHGGLGILFLNEKVKWDADRAQIAAKYDRRYQTLMIELQMALKKIENCESSAYRNQGWYDRYGFMYYEFMAARYKRTGTAM